MKLKTINWSLFLILLLALLLRTFRLTQSPPRLTHDEMSLGYNAYSILKTGKDEWGRFMPLNFEAFGDFKLPGYIYTSVIPIAIFGLNEWSIKIPSIIASLVIIWSSFKIISLLTKNNKLALLAALLAAITPWDIHFARMALESHLALAFYSYSLVFVIKYFQQKNKQIKNLILIALFWSLASYTYVAYRLFIGFNLLSFILTAALVTKNFKVKKMLPLVIAFLFFLLPLLPSYLNHAGTARLEQIFLNNNEGINSATTEINNFCFLNSHNLAKICRYTFTKPQLIIKNIVSNYLESLSITYLFVRGDELVYISNPGFGLFYWPLAIFYLLGAFVILQKIVTNQKNKQSLIFILLAFLFSPISAAIAGDPQAIRLSSLMIFIILFITFGLNYSFNLVKNKKIKFFLGLSLGILILFQIFTYLISYYYVYPAKYANYFYGLSKKTANYLQENENKYDTIYIKDFFPDAHILLAFYHQIDPAWYQQNVTRPSNDNFGFSHPVALGKYYFGDKNFSSIICHNYPDKTLYLGFNEEINLPTIKDFKDFSGVHTEIQVFDTAYLYEKYGKEKLCK